MLKVQPFIGGEGPLFADYIVFGALQWLRTTAGTKVLEEDDPSRSGSPAASTFTAASAIV